MDSTIARFPYLLENLTLYSPDIVGIILGMILMLVFFFLCRYGLLYGYGMSIYLAEKRTIENKKHIL